MKYIVSCLAFALSAWILPGIVIDDFLSLLLATAVWYVVAITVHPFMQLVAIPITIMTLGCAYFFVSALTLYIVEWIVPGFHVAGIWSAVFFLLFYYIIYGFIYGTES